MVKLFDVDSECVYLSGFSMGGYGVFRLYDHSPERFKRLVVFSGHHNIGNMWDINTPDYSQPEMLARLTGVPIYIFHGKADLNCAYHEVAPFFAQLQQVNEQVKICVSEGVGHNGSADWYVRLREWLE
jgi:predicted esterase